MHRLILLTILLVTLGNEASPSFVVVVNQANATAVLSRPQLSDLFLKKTSEWPGLGLVLPVDQPDGSTLRESFNREVHRKSSSALRAYWQQRIFSGRDVPPPEKDGDSEVLAYVRKNPGAIGYVSSKAATGGVRVVEVRWCGTSTSGRSCWCSRQRRPSYCSCSSGSPTRSAG